MTNRTFRSAALTLVAGAALFAACGGSDGDSADSSADSSVTDDSGGEADTDTASDAVTGGGDVGVVGVGVMRIDGVEFGGFEGDCDISRGSGSEDVGDLSAPGLQTIVAIDNVDAGDPDTLDDDLNFIMTNETTFRVRNTDRGQITSITELDARVTDGSRDYVTVRFAGTLDDGRSVEADVYCVLQNQF